MIDPDEIRERAIGSMYEPEFRELADEIERLREAIQKTLDDNGHLADGENCTLIELKRALREVGAGETATGQSLSNGGLASPSQIQK